MKKTNSKIFNYLLIALLITFSTGLLVTMNNYILQNIVNNYIICIVLELFFIVYLSSQISKIKYKTVIIYCLLFTFMTGIIFSTLFIVYKLTSILYVFVTTTLISILFSKIGHETKYDLNKISKTLFIGLITIIAMLGINVFIKSNIINNIICVIGIIVFIGYISLDVQKMKDLKKIINKKSLPLYGALKIYLDFISILVYLLIIIGKTI